MSQENVRYEQFRVTISEDQRYKFESAIGEGEAVSLRFDPESLTGCKDRIAINEHQFRILSSALEKGREVIINMSVEQVKRHSAYMDDDLIFLPV